ncbi:MAG: AMP-binding protein, partial [Desulfobacterales bacterium]|nr:AMP-binding protein [Desulfobacterales bacterium]
MEPLHYKHWPKSVPRTYTLPQTSIYYNLEVSAKRYPAKTAVSYYGSRFSYERLKSEVDTLAGYLQNQCNVKKGDRVILYMQNSPQFIIAYYAILRADAVIVPANPMNLCEEMRHYVKDAGTSIAICGAELSRQLEPMMGGDGLTCVIVASYADYAAESSDIPLPEFLQTTRYETDVEGFVRWEEALGADCKPGPHLANVDDLAAIIYTSGTTGVPKG